MKKLMLILFVLLFCYSGSYAYVQSVPYQSITAGGQNPNSNSMMIVNLNDTCPFIRFDAEWSGGSEASGAAQAYSDILIGEYTYNSGTNSNSYRSEYNSSRYWNSITVYLNAYKCSGIATLRWGW